MAVEMAPPAAVRENSRLPAPEADWHGPGAAAQRPRMFRWRGLLWALVFPQRRHRISLTVPGLSLVVLAVAIGSAAYNTASNILFITLSLLLACLLLSGLLSWFNLMGVCWRLRTPGPWRAGHEAMVTVQVRNRKGWLPTYGLWFELAAQPRLAPEPEDAAKPAKVRDILAAAEKHLLRARLFLRERLEPGGDVALDWVVKPVRRGEALVELGAVGSLFPFGFLRKNLGVALKRPVLVWPAQVEYQWSGEVLARSGAQGRRTARAGAGDDLLALRKYGLGDSHRLIHWKASARLGQLMVRQLAAESHDGYALRLDTPAGVWTRPEQFELFCSFAATLAEDLFASGRLRSVIVNGGTPIETRRLRDVESLLDALARLQPVPEPAAAGAGQGEKRNVITFAPAGTRGVSAYVDGRQTASA